MSPSLRILPSRPPPASRAPDGVRESLLVLSDVHLGSDLTSHITRDGEAPKRSASIDGDLVALLAHYRGKPPEGERWRLVVAGDLIDFIAMAVSADDEALETPLSDEERAHGLGNAADHARIKLRRVAARHAPVFEALAAFVAAGNALTLIHGNHDVEFHWDAVKGDLRRLLADQASLADAEAEAAFQARIDFNPWFYWQEGVAYIEHGHQYDPFCASVHLMAPESPVDPGRIGRGFSDVLLRYVVHQTAGLTESGHEHYGIFDYLGMGVRLGVRGMYALARRFTLAIVELFRLRREYLGEAAQALRLEHERRMGLLADARRIGIDRLRALAAMHALPVTGSIRGILASVLLDRLALGLASLVALLVLGLVGLRHGHALWGTLLVAVVWPLTHRYLSSQRKIDPAVELVARATELVRLFPAAFVVMGHTHVPAHVPIAEASATYINLGSWDEDEPGAPGADDAYRAARTHLVIHVGDAGPRAELLAWDDGAPRRFDHRA